MTADVFGPAIGGIEHELATVEDQLAALHARQQELSSALVLMRRLAGHPDPGAGVAPVPASRVVPAVSAPAAKPERTPQSLATPPTVCLGPGTVLPATAPPKPAPDVARPTTTAGREQRDATDEDDVYQAIVAARGPVSRKELMETLQIGRWRVDEALRVLVREGRVTVSGNTSAQRYALPARARAAAARAAKEAP